MSAAELLAGVALWGSALIVVAVACRRTRAADARAVSDLVLGGRLIAELHAEAERLAATREDA